MKKLLALVMALAMMLALAVPALAADGFSLSKVKVNDTDATISEGSIGEVAQGATITLTFSAKVDDSTVSGNLSVYKNNKKQDAVSVTPTVSEKKISFTLPSDIAEYTDGYTIKLVTGLKDKDGNALAAEQTIKFTVKASGSSSTKTVAVTPSADAITDKVDSSKDLVINVAFNASGSMKHFTVAKSALTASNVVLYKDGVKVSNPSITLADVSADSDKSVIAFTIKGLDEGAEYEFVIPKGDYTSTNDKGVTNTYTIASDFTVAFETLTTETTTAAAETEEIADTDGNPTSSSMSMVVMLSASAVALGAISATRKKED